MDRRHFILRLVGTSVIVAGSSSLVFARNPLMRGSKAKIKWQKNLKEAQKLATKQNKPILIVFGASWCTFCHKLENETLSDKRIATAIEQDFIPVHLDFEKDAKIAQILDVERLPCTVILSPNADLLSKTEGYAEVKEFQATLNSALEKRDEIQQVRGGGKRETR